MVPPEQDGITCVESLSYSFRQHMSSHAGSLHWQRCSSDGDGCM